MHICRHEIVKGLADPGGVVYTVVMESEHTSNVHVIVCERERHNHVFTREKEHVDDIMCATRESH